MPSTIPYIFKQFVEGHRLPERSSLNRDLEKWSKKTGIIILIMFLWVHTIKFLLIQIFSFASDEVNYVTLTLLNLHLTIKNIIPAKARRDRKETRTSP